MLFFTFIKGGGHPPDRKVKASIQMSKYFRSNKISISHHFVELQIYELDIASILPTLPVFCFFVGSSNLFIDTFPNVFLKYECAFRRSV